MTKLKKLPLTLAAGAMALANFSAAPARADDQAIIGLLAGAAAVAILANVAQADHHVDRHRVVVRHDYRPAPPPRWERARWKHRWHHDRGRFRGGEHY